MPFSELPNVDIQFENGNLGIAEPNQSKLMGLIIGGSNAGTDFVYQQPVLVKSITQVEEMGFNADNNPRGYAAIKEFYDIAPLGTPVYVMLIEEEWPYDYYFKPISPGDTYPALDLVTKTNHKIRGIFCQLSFRSSYTPIREKGIDPTVIAAIPEAKTFIENYLFNYKTPIFIVLEASHFNPALYEPLEITDAPGVTVFYGQTDYLNSINTRMQSIGFICGRVASIEPHVNIGRKRDGKMVDKALYFGIEIDNSLATQIHADSCITMRNFPAEDGYFFSDDPFLTEVTSDYRQLTSIRVINEAYRIAYKELSNEVLNDVPVTNTGTVSPIYAKTLEGKVKSAIFDQLGISLSIDQTNKDDKGVECEIDLEQNLIATSTLKLKKLRVRPKGYNRYIEAPLGFTAFNLNND